MIFKSKKPKTKSTRATKPKTSSWQMTKQQTVLLGSFLTLFGIGLLISFTSYLMHWQSDQSELGLWARNSSVDNWLSHLGSNLGHLFIYNGFGLAAYILALLMSVSGIYLFLSMNRKPLQKLWFWGLYLLLWISITAGFFSAQHPLIGGIVGYEINDVLQDYMGFAGTLLLMTFLGMIYLVIRLKWTPDALVHGIKSLFRAKPKAHDPSDQESSINEGFHDQINRPHEDLPSGLEQRYDEALDHEDPIVPDDIAQEDVSSQSPVSVQDKTTPAIKEEHDASLLEQNTSTNDHDGVKMEIETVKEEEAVPLTASEKLVADFGVFDPTLELKNYKFPTIDLLKDYSGGKGITINEQELEEYKNKIISTLNNYNIGIASIKATIGPTVTLYEIVPDAGIRISKIKNLEDDIALSLAALGIRIIAPIPGKGTIGIEVPNKSPQMVSMRSVISSPKFQQAEMELPLALGKTINNETFVVDLAKMPHLLMAGATGQGKSVGLNAILASLLYKKHPAEVKFVLVDPKKVELTLFNKIERHYLAKLPDTDEAIITDTTKVIHTLNSLCIEMDQRYDLLKDAMVRNIKEYNDKFKTRKLNPNEGHRYLPYIVLVIDEFADLIMTAGKEVETPIARLAQLARAIGIHLIIATQRPSVNVITGIIKANFPARIAFRVTSKIDSRTILDSSGADQLIGRGDLLFTQGNELVRLQCAFLDTPEVADITEYIGAQKAYASAFILPEYISEDSGTSLDINIDERDALFRQAAEVLVIAQQGSASLLQRKLKLGYNRAGRIIDQLEAAGIVGPFEGSKARQILVPSIDALNNLLDNGA